MHKDFLLYRFLTAASGAVLPLVLLFGTGGCGSSEKVQEDWQTIPAISATAPLEYRIDSLQKENLHLKEQVNAMAVENRSLTAKNAELETKLTETGSKRSAAVADVAPVIPPGIMLSKEKAKPAPKSTPKATPDYSSALAAFKKRDFKNAILEFESLLNGRVEANLADNCHYWIGESYYATKKYSQAIKHFDQVLEDEKSDKRADAQLMIGNAYFTMGDKDAARNALDKVVASYPSHAGKAKAKLAKIK